VSVLALAAVRGAFDKTPSPRSGRLYYADGQTFAELQTSLAEFEKEWHDAFPEEVERPRPRQQRLVLWTSFVPVLA
jgi:hypothetical protein